MRYLSNWNGQEECNNKLNSNIIGSMLLATISGKQFEAGMISKDLTRGL